MNTENLRVIKLVNGEDIVCELVQTNDNASISILNPILLHQVKIPMGKTIVDSYVLSCWLPLSQEETIDIAFRNIVVTSKPKESLATNYVKFMETLAEEKKEIEDESNTLDSNNGTDVEDLIERFINNFENEEQNDDNIARYTRSGKTIH